MPSGEGILTSKFICFKRVCVRRPTDLFCRRLAQEPKLIVSSNFVKKV